MNEKYKLMIRNSFAVGCLFICYLLLCVFIFNVIGISPIYMLCLCYGVMILNISFMISFYVTKHKTIKEVLKNWLIAILIFSVVILIILLLILNPLTKEVDEVIMILLCFALMLTTPALTMYLSLSNISRKNNNE